MSQVEQTYATVSIRWDDHAAVRGGEVVAEVVLDRAASLNALSSQMALDLASVTRDLTGHAGVRAVVISSASDRAFCVGADLKERARFSDADFMDQRSKFRAAFDGVRGLPVPTVAAVAGWALGGGFEIALCCDLIVADGTAVFGLPEVSLGLVPGGGGTQALARRIGPGGAADLLFTGRLVKIREAGTLGIVDRSVPAGQARAAALDLGRQIAANSPVALRATKAAFRQGLDTDLAAGLDLEDTAWRSTIRSADRGEGIAAFNDKRTPIWPSPAT